MLHVLQFQVSVALEGWRVFLSSALDTVIALQKLQSEGPDGLARLLGVDVKDE